MEVIFILIDIILFLICTVWVVYFLIFSIASRIKRKKIYPMTDLRNRFLVIFPAYREDAVIIQSIKQFFQQTYPPAAFKVVVVADSMSEATNKELHELGADVLIPSYLNRSKAAALKLALKNYSGDSFDAAAILDADNIVDPDFLERVNEALANGAMAIQTHRIAKNYNTDLAYLDGIGEEINNAIFRQGHVNLGLPSALIGSGMVFNMEWFTQAMPKVHSMGEDKELEFLLLQDRIFIEYLPHVLVKDEKVHNRKDFSNQRKRWIASQWETFLFTLNRLGPILRQGNLPLLDKFLQWSLPPRVILLGLLFLWILLLQAIAPLRDTKWFFILIAYVFALFFAVPKKYYTTRTLRSVANLPFIFMAILRSFSSVNKANKTFIHTPHGIPDEDNRNRSAKNIQE